MRAINVTYHEASDNAGNIESFSNIVVTDYGREVHAVRMVPLVAVPAVLMKVQRDWLNKERA
jgi:hypothetical protein